MYIYDRLGHVVERTATASLESRQVDTTQIVYNDSMIALAYGFVDYFDEESFGRLNTMLRQATAIHPSKFGQSSQLATATPFIVTIGMASLMLRFFARTRFRVKFWWDDLFAVLATMLIIAEQL